LFIAQIIHRPSHDRSRPLDIESAVLLVEVERHAGWRPLLGWRCVGKDERQCERDNYNRRDKPGATREGEKTGDNPIRQDVVILAEVRVLARPLAELVAPPTMRHHAELSAAMIADLMLADLRPSHHALARQPDGISLR
jgi:hypothetical protein